MVVPGAPTDDTVGPDEQASGGPTGVNRIPGRQVGDVLTVYPAGRDTGDGLSFQRGDVGTVGGGHEGEAARVK